MKPFKKAGFTIVETMLFLGISGLLAMGIFVGVGSSISIQRYRDSVVSFRSFLQQQYSDVANASNINDVSSCGGIDSLRGQSECVILGRFIRTINNRSLSVQNIIGYIPSGMTSLVDDIQSLKDYKVEISPLDSSIHDIEWGSLLKKTIASGGNDAVFSILILRSPASGAVRTFINNTQSLSSVTEIRNLISSSSLSVPVTICLDSRNLMNGASNMAVRINPNATGASSVETLGEVSGC